MLKVILSFLLLISLLSVKDAYAQVQYEDVVEKIHYTHPNRGIGSHDPYDAKKQFGSTAPILKVYIWGDLGERFTKKFFTEVFPSLKDKYSNEALFIYNHRAFLMQDKSVQAGMLGECTARQGKFWENVNPILDNGDLGKLDYLKEVNIDQIKECLKDPYTKTVIEVSENDGKYFGFNGIPTTIVQNASKPLDYSVKVNGSQDLQIFERAFLEAKEGDLTKKELQDLKSEVSNLKEDVKQTQEDVKQTKQEVQGLRALIETILKQIQALFELIKPKAQ